MLFLLKKQLAAWAILSVCLGSVVLQADAASYQYRVPAPGLVAASVASASSASDCSLPWGGSIASGSSYTSAPVYSASVVYAPATCTAITLSCANGALSAPNASLTCQVGDAEWANVRSLLTFENVAATSTSITDQKSGLQWSPTAGSYPGAVTSGSAKTGNNGFSTNYSAPQGYATNGSYQGGIQSGLNVNLSGDYTIEFWYKILRAEVDSYAFITTPPNGQPNTYVGFYSYSGGRHQFSEIINGALQTQIYGPYYTVGQWYHIAMVRKGTVRTLYVDGVSQGTSTYSGVPTIQSSSVVLGRVGTYIQPAQYDDFRITASARYSSNFTPPSVPPATQ